MKKTIAILLVAILAVGSVFATTFSGEAKLGFGGNLDTGEYGFIDKSANVKFDLDLATANAESIGDGDVYASIKATFGLKLTTGEKKYGEGDPYGGMVNGDSQAIYGSDFGLAIIADITEAKVGGENWYVSILGAPDAPNFAESAIDTYTVENGYDKYGLKRDDFDKAYNYGVGFEKATGVEVGVYDYKFGFGLLGDYDDVDTWKFEDDIAFSLSAQTPEYNFNGVIAQVGAVYSYKGAPVDADVKNAIGLSAKAGFANDTLTATVATDMGFNLEGDKFEDVFDMDLAANFGWNFLTLDAYYGTYVKSGETPAPAADGSDWDKTTPSYKEDVLSFQAKFDLNTFDVPVAITASVKDVLKTVELGVKAEVTAVENLKITANAGYVVNTVDAYDKDINKMAKDNDVFLGQWKIGADVEYDFGFAKVAAGVSAKNVGAGWAADAISGNKGFDEVLLGSAFDSETLKNAIKENNPANYICNRVVLGASASITTSSIIPGAELKLAWENGDDLLKVYQYDGDDYYNFGKITASCKIAF